MCIRDRCCHVAGDFVRPQRAIALCRAWSVKRERWTVPIRCATHTEAPQSQRSRCDESKLHAANMKTYFSLLLLLVLWFHHSESRIDSNLPPIFFPYGGDVGDSVVGFGNGVCSRPISLQFEIFNSRSLYVSSPFLVFGLLLFREHVNDRLCRSVWYTEQTKRRGTKWGKRFVHHKNLYNLRNISLLSETHWNWLITRKSVICNALQL